MSLSQRMQHKSRKPRFKRQDLHKRPRLDDRWRKARGSDAKMRTGLRGYGRSPNVGWGSPADAKGLDKDGFREIHVHKLSDIKVLDPKKDVAVISHTVGLRKKIELIKELMKTKIKIHNYKDPKKFLEQADRKLKEKKKEKEARIKDKQKKKEEIEEKKKEEEESQKEESTEEDGLAEKVEEDQREKEKKDKDKIITKSE